MTAKNPINANSGLRKEESIGNRRLFGFDGIGNESRKDMNQKINRESIELLQKVIEKMM